MKKKNNVENIPPAGADCATFNTVEDLIKYLEQYKKALLEYSVKNDICIRDFADGYMAMNIGPKIHQDLMMNFQKFLTHATGKTWKIEIIKGDLGETIADKEKTIVEAKKKNVSEYPLVKKILEEFRGSKIETVVRKNLQEIVEEEAENSDETITSTEIEEEE